MHTMPLPVLFGIVGALLIVAIYFVWGRKGATKPAERQASAQPGASKHDA